MWTCVSEPRHPCLVCRPSRPTTVLVDSRFLAVLGHLFFQWPNPRHRAHRLGCNVGPGFHGGLLKDWSPLQEGGAFMGSPAGFPKAAGSIANLWSALLLSSLHLFSVSFLASVSLFLNTLLAISISWELDIDNTPSSFWSFLLISG